MLPARNILPLLLFLPLAAILQEGQDEGPDQQPARPAPLTALRETELERIQRELPGTWLMVRYDSSSTIIDQSSISGFATFQEGFMTLELLAKRSPGLIHRENKYVQAEVNRYRVNEQLKLQTANVMGFHNVTRTGRLSLVADAQAKEYSVTVGLDSLVLGRSDGSRMHFRRVKAGQFPAQAIEALNRTR